MLKDLRASSRSRAASIVLISFVKSAVKTKGFVSSGFGEPLSSMNATIIMNHAKQYFQFNFLEFKYFFTYAHGIISSSNIFKEALKIVEKY
jgi:hypothetical protein